MGQFLQSPDPSIKLARQYGIRGLFSPDLVPSLQPTVLIDDLTGGVENNPVRLAVAVSKMAGVAAEFAVHRFETPPGIIARIIRIGMNVELNTLVQFHFGASVAAPATFLAGVLTDGRLRSKGELPAAKIGFDTYGTAPAVSDFQLAGQSTTNLMVFQEVNFIMGRIDAFDFLEVWHPVVDKDLNISWLWEEFTADAAK